MSASKHIDKICCIVLAVTLIITVIFINSESLGVKKASAVLGYEEKLFDISAVHSVEIIMDNWDEFISNCKNEEYYVCTVVIDNEAYKNVAIRGKGNTSLTQVASYGNNRYSFKIEFDRYDTANTYYGLDKLCLNNIIQDNTYMKDYLVYRMMLEQGVSAPLCSYVYITVNGEEWGLYLAVEGVEDSFLKRCYGKESGELYKPDSTDMGGGRGNGEKFDMKNFTEDDTTEGETTRQSTVEISDMSKTAQSNAQMPPQMPDGQMPDNMPDDMPSDGGNTPPSSEKEGSEDGEGSAESGERPSLEMPSNMPNGQKFGGMMNSEDDVLLKYIDDEIDSYSNIFDNAKTDVTKADKKRLINSLKNLSESIDIADTVEVERVIKYFVVHNFVLNFDSYTGSMIHNYYLYESDGKMEMIPWDYNLAFGGFQAMGGATELVNYPIDTPVSGGSVEDRPMLAWIFASEEYTELYHRYFSEFISEYFESGYFEEMFESTYALILPYVEKDPTKFCTYEEFQKGAEVLKSFCSLRAESISGQLDGAIGSTSDSQGNSELINADELNVSDMGTMNNSQNGGEQGVWQIPSLPSDDSDSTEQSEQPQEAPNGKMQPEGRGEHSADEAKMNGNGESSAAIPLLCLSCAVLIFGLVFALLFDKRKR